MTVKRIILSIFLGLGILGSSVASIYDDWPDDSVCLWLDMRPGNTNYLSEARKRNITCQNGKAISSINTSSNSKVPDNAHALGNTWRCNSGYYKDNLSCKKAPDNAHGWLSEGGDGWECDWQYIKSGNGCIPKNTSNKIPFNATASGSSWKCNPGFKRSYVNENSCVKTSSIKIPANAYASGFDNQGWKCNSGFTQSGNSCKKNTNNSSNSPANSYKTASGWKCNSGFFRLSTSDYCYSLPDNAYALSPIGFACKSGYKKSQYDYVCIKSSKISNIKSNDNSKDANDKYVSDTLEGKGVLGKVLSWAGLTNSKSPKTKVSSQKKIVIPANAYAYNNSWKCLDGYKKTGNSCTKEIYIPANAYASGTSWQCIDGYKKKGYRCAKLTWKDGDYWDQEVSPGVSRISAFGAILTQMGSNNRTNTNFNTNLRNTSPKFKYRYGDQMYDSNNSFMGYIRNGVTYDRSMRQTGTIRNNNIYNNTGNYVVPLGQDYKPANATFDMTPGF